MSSFSLFLQISNFKRTMASSFHGSYFFFFNVIVFIIAAAIPSFSLAQTAASCNGILLSYAYTGGTRLPPNVSDPAKQPYRFESTITVQNNGLDELKSWKVFVGFQHDEYLVSVSNAVLADGTSLPASVGNGTVFAGYPMTDLKTAVETAGDLTQMQVQIKLVGTLFGVAPSKVPMPSNITLANDGFVCRKPTGQGKKKKKEHCCFVWFRSVILMSWAYNSILVVWVHVDIFGTLLI